jgi:hypothetical protein
VAFVATVAVAVQPLSLSAQQTQRSGDSVVTLAADVADAAGRLLIGAQHLLEGDDPFVLMVGEIAYDGVLPEIAPLMAATMEDSLVQATSRMSVHRTVRVRTGVTAPSVPGGEEAPSAPAAPFPTSLSAFGVVEGPPRHSSLSRFSALTGRFLQVPGCTQNSTMPCVTPLPRRRIS